MNYEGGSSEPAIRPAIPPRGHYRQFPYTAQTPKQEMKLPQPSHRNLQATTHQSLTTGPASNPPPHVIVEPRQTVARAGRRAVERSAVPGGAATSPSQSLTHPTVVKQSDYI